MGIKINSVSVTIGRNYAATNQPMPLSEWRTFQRQVSDALHRTSSYNADRWTETHTGSGSWNGYAEESAKITMLGASFTDMVTLRKTLDVLRVMYGQDAIALAAGSSELV